MNRLATYNLQQPTTGECTSSILIRSEATQPRRIGVEVWQAQPAWARAHLFREHRATGQPFSDET